MTAVCFFVDQGVIALQNGHRRTALRISGFNMLINALLAIEKLLIGCITQSDALLSDGVHSVADTLSGLVLIVGICLSSRKADTKHPYGYDRLECVAAVLLAVVIGITGITIGLTAVKALLSPTTESVPQSAAIWAALTAIAVKEMMFRYTRRVADRTNSSALLADAWHQRSDALSSVGGLIGVVGARMGYDWLDSTAGAFIALMIIKAAIDIFADATRKMTDCSCSELYECRLCERVAICDCVEEVEELKTRLFGSSVYAEVTVAVSGELSSKEAYDVVHMIKKLLKEEFPEMKDCSVHIHPR